MKYINHTLYFEDGSKIFIKDLDFLKSTHKRTHYLRIIRMIKIINILNYNQLN